MLELNIQFNCYSTVRHQSQNKKVLLQRYFLSKETQLLRRQNHAQLLGHV